MPNTDNDDNKGRRIMLLVVAALVATLLINMLYNAVSNAYLTQISYTEFKELMAEDKISEVSFKSDDRGRRQNRDRGRACPADRAGRRTGGLKG